MMYGFYSATNIHTDRNGVAAILGWFVYNVRVN